MEDDKLKENLRQIESACKEFRDLIADPDCLAYWNVCQNLNDIDKELRFLEPSTGPNNIVALAKIAAKEIKDLRKELADLKNDYFLAHYGTYSKVDSEWNL